MSSEQLDREAKGWLGLKEYRHQANRILDRISELDDSELVLIAVEDLK